MDERYWPAMRAALDEEVLHRARALAAEGVDALLADLHDRIRWEKPVLTLVKPLEQLPITHAAQAARLLVAGRGLGTAVPALLAGLAVGAGYAMLAAILLKVFEVESRRRASLDAV